MAAARIRKIGPGRDHARPPSVWLPRRVPPFKLLMTALGFAVIAEALSWAAAGVSARFAGEGLVYRFCAGFHGPADALRFHLFRDVENHPAFADDIAMRFVFFGAALLQWLLIFLAGFVLLRLFIRKRA
jgi:hypothetical protein